MIPEIGLITRSKPLINLAEKISKLLDVNLFVADIDNNDVQEAVAELQSKGINCIIAQGNIADSISEIKEINVIKCDPKPQDVMESLINIPINVSKVVIILRKSESTSRLFTSEVVRHIHNISGRKIVMYSYKSENELNSFLKEQIRKGQNWYVGSKRVVDLVNFYGKKSVELAVGEETMLNTFNEAIKVFNHEKYYKNSDLQKIEISGIVARSPQMKNILTVCKTVAKVDTTIFMLGESGVGKGLLAHFIHHQGHRSKGPFIKINCSAIPPSLIESELFGYEEGTFTGAKKGGKIGLIESAKGGTLFLDEIAELPTTLQVKFLQVLQEKQFIRVGGSKLVKANIRIIAATNRNIVKMVQEGSFREDLYYRLNVVPIEIPPLRERKEDIEVLVYYFLKKFNELYTVKKCMSKDVVDRLCQYPWPGNVRELSNIIERVVVTTFRKKITLSDLPLHVREYNSLISEKNLGFKEEVELFKAKKIQEAYKELGSSYKVAKKLGISQRTAARLIKKYLNPPFTEI